MAAELGQSVVGYYDDVDRDAGSQAFWALRNNLSSAVTLPLVGFFTPDLRWVHGFSGHTDSTKFRSDVERARTMSRSQGALPRDGATRETVMLGSLPDAELADVGDELVADLEAPIAPAMPLAIAASPALAATAPSTTGPSTTGPSTTARGPGRPFARRQRADRARLRRGPRDPRVGPRTREGRARGPRGREGRRRDLELAADGP